MSIDFASLELLDDLVDGDLPDLLVLVLMFLSLFAIVDGVLALLSARVGDGVGLAGVVARLGPLELSHVLALPVSALLVVLKMEPKLAIAKYM